jgi:hypothetical protein
MTCFRHMMRPTDPRDPRQRDQAEGIGWMVMAAASLDVWLAMLASGLNPNFGRDWMTIASQRGGSLLELRKIPDRRLHANVQQLRGRRPDNLASGQGQLRFTPDRCQV